MKRSFPAPLLGSAILAFSLGLFAIEIGAQPGDARKQCPRNQERLASAQPGDTIQCQRDVDAKDCPRAMDCPGSQDRPSHHDAHTGSHRRITFLAQALGLDATQQALVGAIDSGWLLETEPPRQRMGGKREALRALRSRGAGTQAEAERLIDEIAALRAQVEKTRFMADQRIRALLTPEQQAKFDALPLPHPGGPGRPHHGKGMRGPRLGSTPGVVN